MVAEAISILPLGVGSGWPPGRGGSARAMPPSSGRCRQHQFARLPEVVEVRRVEALARAAPAGRLVEMPQPVARAAALGEALARCPAARRGRRRSRSRRAPRRYGSASRCMATISGSVWRGCRYPRAPGSSSPARTISACRAVAVQASSCTTSVSSAAEGLAQPVEVLMVVERVAAGPVDQPDVGIGQALAVVVERLARDAAACRRCARPG